MKIALDACCLGRKKTGNETYIRGLLHGFSQISSDQIDFNILTTDACSVGRNPKFRWHDLPLGNFVTRNFYTIPRRLNDSRIDLFHGVYWARWWDAPPYVLTVHDMSYVGFPQGFRMHERLVYANLIRETARRAKAVITISEYSKRDICEKWKIPEEKVHVTYLAADPAFENRLPENPSSNPETENTSEPYILFVGNLHPRKNLSRLLEAFVLLRREKGIKVKMKIVGQKAWLYDDIFDTVRRNNIGTAVEFTGYVDQAELKRLYRGAAVMCYPSLFEGFGLPILEAMWSGCPVVASKITSIPEVAGGAAVLVDPYSSEDIARGLCEILESSLRRDELVKQGFIQAKKFDWKTTASQTLDVYTSKNVSL